MCLRSVCLFVLSVSALFPASPAFASDTCKGVFLDLVDSGQVVSVNGLAIAPDYSAFYYTEWSEGRARLAVRKCREGHWQAAQPLFPPHAYADYQPVLSLNGRRLYFTSTRALSGSKALRQNIWYAEMTEDWRKPRPIEPLMSPYWDGHAVEIAPDVILFASARAGERRMVDIYRANLAARTIAAEPVDTLNTDQSDNDMAYEPRAGILVFSRYDPETEDVDLYVSFGRDGGWTAPVCLQVSNTDEWEMSPAFTPDGNFLLFKRGDGAFQRIALSAILELQ